MRLSYTNCFATLLLVLLCATGVAQEREVLALRDMGFENIQVVKDGENIYVSLQDVANQGVARGVDAAIDALRTIDPEQTLHILLQNNGVPQLAVTAPSDMGALTVSYDTELLVESLRGVKRENRSFGRVDFVLYPELFLENSWHDKLYGTAVNISPAIELSLWRGAKATGQVVIPIYTNMTDEKQYVRPGVITFQQDVRLWNQLYGSFSVGNFTDDRVGMDARVNYYTKDGRWNFGARGGLTGSSTFYGGEWVVGTWQRVTWSGWASYYMAEYNLEITGQVVQKVYGDKGLEGSVRRYFNDVYVGMYAMVTDGEFNGGFSFCVPIPGHKRPKRNRGVRVTYPEYFTRIYKARNGSESLTSFSYETTPDAGGLQDFYNPYYVKKEMLR